MTQEAEKPADPTPLNQENAWGYCRFCAFIVAREPDGIILYHEARMYGMEPTMCHGSGRMPTEAPLEADRLIPVNLTKSSYYLIKRRQRLEAEAVQRGQRIIVKDARGGSNA